MTGNGNRAVARSYVETFSVSDLVILNCAAVYNVEGALTVAIFTPAFVYLLNR